MSLVDETGYALNTTLTAVDAFNMLFHGNIKLKDASGLLLPATNLSRGCYYSMFYGCTSLTAAPALPATRLESNCYTLMFRGCTSLTAAPALPAKKMKPSCYSSMFQGCTSLKSVTCLATDIRASYCTKNWLQDVASKGTFTTPSSTNWSTGPSGIPSGWTRVDY